MHKTLFLLMSSLSVLLLSSTSALAHPGIMSHPIMSNEASHFLSHLLITLPFVTLGLFAIIGIMQKLKKTRTIKARD